MKPIYELVHAVEKAGHSLNAFVSIVPTAGSDSQRKRECARRIAHLGQSLKRHGHLHFGLTVYEKPIGGALHAHHLAHIPRNEADILWRRHNPPTVHVRRADAGALGYITKERLPLGPEFEALIGHRRRKAASIPGKRWSATTAARALITEGGGLSASPTSFRPSKACAKRRNGKRQSHDAASDTDVSRTRLWSRHGFADAMSRPGKQ